MKDKDSLGALVEAILFMSDRPLTLKKIHGYIEEEVALEELQEVLISLQKDYQSARHGISLVEVAGGFQFRTKQDYAGYIKKLCKATTLVLSPTAMEVLAIIAYRGPMAKSDIDKIRGVDSSYIIRGLMEKGLIRTVGRSEQLSRASLYQTTRKFLEMFNLSDLSELPPEHELKEMVKEDVGAISDIRMLARDSDISHSDELEELDRLGEEIKKISADTDFTKALRSERRSISDGAFRSAFEILSEHIGKKDIEAMNNLAVQSDSVSIKSLINKKARDEYDEELLSQGDSTLEKGEARLDHLTGKMIDDARKLDLDLDFINDE